MEAYYENWENEESLEKLQSVEMLIQFSFKLMTASVRTRTQRPCRLSISTK